MTSAGGGPLRLGVDIGGTKTLAAVVTEGGEVVATRSAPSGRGARQVVEVAAATARHALDLVGGIGAVSGVGVCIPGLVDPVAGTARNAANLGVDFVALAKDLGAALGCEVRVANDVKAAAHGAVAWLAGGSTAVDTRGAGALAYLNVGTGLGSALVRDGVVDRGIGGVAGEIGHLPIGGGIRCACGQTGCLETIASGSALTRMWPDAASAGESPFRAAVAGDERAAIAIATICAGIGLAIETLALAAGAEFVVIGGGLTALGDDLHAGIRANLAQRAAASAIIDSLDLPGRFAFLPDSLPVAAIGAACLSGAAVGQAWGLPIRTRQTSGPCSR